MQNNWADSFSGDGMYSTPSDLLCIPSSQDILNQLYEIDGIDGDTVSESKWTDGNIEDGNENGEEWKGEESTVMSLSSFVVRIRVFVCLSQAVFALYGIWWCFHYTKQPPSVTVVSGFLNYVQVPEERPKYYSIAYEIMTTERTWVSVFWCKCVFLKLYCLKSLIEFIFVQICPESTAFREGMMCMYTNAVQW